MDWCCCSCGIAETYVVTAHGRTHAAHVDTLCFMNMHLACACRNAVDRMREDGLVLTDLAHKADGQLHGSSVWQLSPQQQGQELPFHRFAQVSTRRH